MKTIKELFEEIKNQKDVKDAPGQDPIGTPAQHGTTSPSVLPSELNLTPGAQRELSKHAVEGSKLNIERQKKLFQNASQMMDKANKMHDMIQKKNDLNTELKVSRLKHSLNVIKNSGEHSKSDNSLQAQNNINIQLKHHDKSNLNNKDNKGVK
jgi:hypothetical protein